MRVLNVWRVQMEADKLKADPRTKLLAGGTINSGVDVTELNNVASPPLDMNVILIYDEFTLDFVLEQIINASCKGPYSLMLLLLLFFTPVLNSQGIGKKLRYAIQKVQKVLLLIYTRGSIDPRG